MFWFMAASLALSVAGGMASKSAADKQAANNRMWAEYNNELVHKSNATNQGIISHNIVLGSRETAQEAVEIQANTLRAAGAAEVAAATAGVEGVNADGVILDITRTGLKAENIRQDEWAAQMASHDNDRTKAAEGAAGSLKNTNFTGGSGLAIVLGAAQAGFSSYKTDGFNNPFTAGGSTLTPDTERWNDL